MKSVHHQMLLCGTCFLLGNMFAFTFFHTHFTKEYIQKNHLKNYRGKLHIFVKQRHLMVKGFVDTGNHLYEPLTGLPVCLVEYEAAKKALYPEFMKYRVHPIPYKTIDHRTGILWGITADKVIFQNKWRKIIKSGCVIAFFNGKLNQSGEYKAIIHPDILEK